MTMMSVVVGPNGASMQTFDGFKAATREKAKEEADLQDSQTIALPHFIIEFLKLLCRLNLCSVNDVSSVNHILSFPNMLVMKEAASSPLGCPTIHLFLD